MSIHWNIECDWCDNETYVSLNRPFPEPSHCPMCGEECKPTRVHDDEEDLEDLGDIIDME